MKYNSIRNLVGIVLIALISMSCMLLQTGRDASSAVEVSPEPVQEESKSEPLPEEEVNVQEEELGEEIRQWAISATASSEYGNPDWAASQATDQPDTTEECGDYPTAWASAERTGVDWLELIYEKPVYPEQINIYQNNLPDQVVEVELLDTDGTYHTVYTGQPEVTDCPYTLTINLSDVDYQATGVKVTVDQSILNPTSWNEIDAVELVGRYVGGEIPSEDTPPPEEAPAGDYELPELLPSNLAPGTFQYDIVGAGEDISIEGSTLQYQSTSDEYVIGLISDDMRYSLSLFMPLELGNGPLRLIPYEGSSFSKSPSTAIYIGFSLFEADGGLMMLEEVDDTITGSFTFVAHERDDPSQVVTVSGVFRQIPLEE